MQDVNDLQIYQNAMKLIAPIYKLVNLLPRNEVDLRDQILRSSKSVASNIAEGFAKKDSQLEFKRFLLISIGSSDETINHLRQIKLIKFPNIKEETCDILIKFYKIESRQINKLISTIKTNLKSNI